jgi:hypothetical protein
VYAKQFEQRGGNSQQQIIRVIEVDEGFLMVSCLQGAAFAELCDREEAIERDGV